MLMTTTWPTGAHSTSTKGELQHAIIYRVPDLMENCWSSSSFRSHLYQAGISWEDVVRSCNSVLKQQEDTVLQHSEHALVLEDFKNLLHFCVITLNKSATCRAKTMTNKCAEEMNKWESAKTACWVFWFFLLYCVQRYTGGRQYKRQIMVFLVFVLIRWLLQIICSYYFAIPISIKEWDYSNQIP